MRDVSVAVLVRAGQDAVGAGSGWLRSPAILARVVEQRLSFKTRETGFRVMTHWLSAGGSVIFRAAFELCARGCGEGLVIRGWCIRGRVWPGMRRARWWRCRGSRGSRRWPCRERAAEFVRRTGRGALLKETGAHRCRGPSHIWSRQKSSCRARGLRVLSRRRHSLQGGRRRGQLSWPLRNVPHDATAAKSVRPGNAAGAFPGS